MIHSLDGGPASESAPCWFEGGSRCSLVARGCRRHHRRLNHSHAQANFTDPILLYRERITAATRRAAATPSPSAAATARDARPRIRPSRDSPSATWSSLLLSVTSLTPRSSPSTPSPRCTSSCSTVSLAPFTARLSVSAPAWVVATVLLLPVSVTTRTARRSLLLRVLRPRKRDRCLVSLEKKDDRGSCYDLSGNFGIPKGSAWAHRRSGLLKSIVAESTTMITSQHFPNLVQGYLFFVVKSSCVAVNRMISYPLEDDTFPRPSDFCCLMQRTICFPVG